MSATGLGDLYAGSVEGYQQMSDMEVYWDLRDNTKKMMLAAGLPERLAADARQRYAGLSAAQQYSRRLSIGTQRRLSKQRSR
jgi:hypothetical protein